MIQLAIREDSRCTSTNPTKPTRTNETLHQEQPTTERRTQNVDSSTRRDTCQLRRGEIVPINPDTESPRTHRMPVEMQRRPERSNDVISTKHHEAIKMDILNNVL